MNHADPSYASAVEERLRASLAPRAERGSGRLLAAARHLCGAGGKRIRPALVRSYGELLGVEPAALVDLAAAVELMHAASLLHDDVVDEGTVRRGRPTANALEGNMVAVLAGDLALATALELLAPHPRVAADAVSVVRTMTCAAILEVEARGDVDLDPSACEAIAEGKTGALFAFCGRAVATLADAPSAAPSLTTCGLRLGVAFQLGDDLLDLLPSDAGKDRFADLSNRNPSYPLALAFREEPVLRERARALYRAPEVERTAVVALGEAVLRTRAVEVTRRRMLSCMNAARAALAGVSAVDESEDALAWAARLLRVAVRPEVLACVAS